MRAPLPAAAPVNVWIIPGADNGPVHHCAWQAFARDNPDVVDDVLEQFRARGMAYVGGGAGPLIWIMPAQDAAP